ncbi:MAG: hypothetical protein JWP87_5232 [Labilithrix sp.]|jgi:hypothetical protein|nr:hypothetical protein [Labilithrix sp.]
MLALRCRVLLLSVVTVAVAGVVVAREARAQEECPLGSTQKSENGQTWCEPTVCETDTNCPTGSICRPVPLCVEIGALDQAPGTKTDAGQRLLVRQRCGAGKSCPQRTTCSEKSRCITRAQADKAGLLTPSAAASNGAGTAPKDETEAPKKACGCSIPGAARVDLAGAALAMLGAVVVVGRRRTRTRRR